MSEERLSFHALNREVVEQGICAMCYGCVCFCSAHELNALTIKEDKPTYLDEEKCLKCGICYLICPRTTALDHAIKTRFGFKEPIGSYQAIRCLRTTDERVGRVCCDGGIVTGILKFLLETGEIDGAVLSKREGLWKNQPTVATNFDELLECAGSRLSPSESLRGMENLTTYAPIFSAFRESRMLDLARLTVVGSPCQIQTIRRMQLLKIFPSTLVHFTVGLFCFENFLLSEDEKRYLEKKIGAKLEQIKKINLKDNLIVKLRSGRTVHIDLDELSPIVRPACLACTDFANFTADISVGGLGSPEGYTTTIVRSQIANRVVREAISQGYFTEIDHEGVTEKVAKIAKRKKKRGERVLAEKKAYH